MRAVGRKALKAALLYRTGNEVQPWAGSRQGRHRLREAV